MSVDGVDVFSKKIEKNKQCDLKFHSVTELKYLEIYKTLKTKSILVTGKSNKRVKDMRQHICWIANDTLQKKINESTWKKYKKVFEESTKYKINIDRSDKKNIFFDKYVCYGYRKNMTNNQVSEYTFKRNTDSAKENDLKEHIEQLVHLLEDATAPFFNRIPRAVAMKKLCMLKNVNTIGSKGQTTQFGVATRFCSSVHCDNDYNYSTLSAISYDKNVNPDDVIYYFTFPTYDITIPIYNGMILIFDPTIPHCCSNPMFNETYIFSCYVSKKTVNTDLATNRKNEE